MVSYKDKLLGFNGDPSSEIEDEQMETKFSKVKDEEVQLGANIVENE